MGFKDEFKREMRNVMKDVEKEVHKTWTIEYKGHCIEIINQIKEELLIIDGVTVDKKKRKSLFSHLKPYSTLSGPLEQKDGTKQTVFVKIGGLTKLNCIVKVDNETILDDSQKLDFYPWDHKEKIVPYIQQQVQTHNRIEDDYLPDEEYLYDENHPRLAAGLSDTFADDIPTPFYAKKLLKLFEEQINHPTPKTRKATYEKIIFDNIASYGSEFIERFQEAQLDESLVQQEALWLLENAAHREVVKLSITILGCTNCEKYKELLFTIGLHEEFTQYVIFALKNGTIQANEQIWKLAQSLRGWGKIAAVEQLESLTEEKKRWLLTKGCENTIMNDYLAYTCAIKGELDVFLYDETISKELYDGAGIIIQGLLSENAPKGIDDYAYAGAVLSRFVYHARTHCQTLEDFYRIMKISSFLEEDQEIWEVRLTDQWKQHERISIQQEIQTLIENHKWSDLAIEVLQKGYNYKALEISRFYKLEIKPILFELLEKDPTNSEIYLAIMERNNRQDIIDLCLFAETHLCLSNLSSIEQDCLQYIIQDLYEHEGVGLPLVQAALNSDNGSLQYHALCVLEGWTPLVWKQPALQTAIKTIATMSKDKEDRQIAKRLLKK